MSQELKNQLTNIVQETAIADIIMADKKDMDLALAQEKLSEWVKHKRELENDLVFAKNHIKDLRNYIKKNCKHTDVTEHIQNGWERAEHSYSCNQCGSNVRIHDEFSYKNITKVIEY